jgi:hypothetical protein
MEGILIPRNLKYTSKYNDNNVENIRNRLRANHIFHKNFNPALGGIEGGKYFSDVYEFNNPKHVEENNLNSEESKNFYKYLITNKKPKPPKRVQAKQKE